MKRSIGESLNGQGKVFSAGSSYPRDWSYFEYVSLSIYICSYIVRVVGYTIKVFLCIVGFPIRWSYLVGDSGCS